MKQLTPFLLLTLISIIVASCTDGERMRQQLAELQARNQADSLLTDDSLAISLCDYFDSHGSPNEQMLAHYLLARTYTDMGEAPQALDEFHRAAECADTTTPEFSRNGVGFKVVIGPDRYDPYKGDVRTLLRIHPARGNATEGCIGLQTNNIEELESLERIFKTSLIYNNSIPLGVSILNR